MDLYGVSPEVITACLAAVNPKYEYNLRFNTTRQKQTRNGWRIRGVLRPLNTRARGARLSGSGRYCTACSWEAHRDFMHAIFAHNPCARIKTMLADYRGAADFETKFPATADHNIGSVREPLTISDASIY